MSMFHELMMRKKEEIMYATIKGSLTESPKGVFSGFSTSNYLEVQGLYDFSKPFEIKTKIKIGSTPSASSFITVKNSNVGSIIVMVGNGWNIGFYITDSNGNSIVNGVYTPNNILSSNTDYFVKVVFTGTEYACYISTDDTTYTKYSIVTSLRTIGNSCNIKLGANPPNQSFAVGTIDLNQTNIKLGSTKYNLQAVVGYTIVGSPTIVDGVMTNITSSNTVRVNTPIGNNWNSLEFNIKAKVSDLGGHYGNIFGQSYYLLFRVEGSKYNLWYRIDANSNWVTKATNVVISESSLYEINLKIKNDGKFVFSLYDNNGSLLDSLIFVDADNLPIFNNNLTCGLLNGNITVNEIDLNSTYIKINNKLWFNGQQA